MCRQCFYWNIWSIRSCPHENMTVRRICLITSNRHKPMWLCHQLYHQHAVFDQLNVRKSFTMSSKSNPNAHNRVTLIGCFVLWINSNAFAWCVFLTPGGGLTFKRGIFGTLGRQETMMSACYGRSEDLVFSGATTGDVYIWKDTTLTKSIKAHDGPVFAMCSLDKVSWFRYPA